MGCAIRATGDNPQMARAQGINTNNMITLGLVLSNGLVALSGALIAQSQSFADVQMGIGSIVIGLASVIIGEVIFGTRNFLNCLVSLVLGAITYRIIIALVLKLGMPANDLKLFTAITVVIALSLPVFKKYLQPIKKSVKGGDL
jgi:putative ABC transport system permease protein